MFCRRNPSPWQFDTERERRHKDTHTVGYIYKVELTEKKSDGESGRDRESELDSDGDRCLTQDSSHVFAAGYILTVSE